MKLYELIKGGNYCDSCYANTIQQARAKFKNVWTGVYTIICTGNDWERKNVRL